MSGDGGDDLVEMISGKENVIDDGTEETTGGWSDVGVGSPRPPSGLGVEGRRLGATTIRRMRRDMIAGWERSPRPEADGGGEGSPECGG